MTLFAEGHNWTETAKVEATCKNPGSASYKCDKCSVEYTVTEPQKDHAVKSTVVLPTCTQRGYTEIACVMCDYKSIIDYFTISKNVSGRFGSNRSFAHITVTRFSVSLRFIML